MSKQIKADLEEIVEAVISILGDASEGNGYRLTTHKKRWWIEHRYVGSSEPFDQFLRTALEKFVVEQEWISVEDRLPERNENVLILRDKPFRTYHVTAFQRDGVFISNETAKELIKVTHWMPLPDPPKKGGDDE